MKQIRIKDLYKVKKEHKKGQSVFKLVPLNNNIKSMNEKSKESWLLKHKMENRMEIADSKQRVEKARAEMECHKNKAREVFDTKKQLRS